MPAYGPASMQHSPPGGDDRVIRRESCDYQNQIEGPVRHGSRAIVRRSRAKLGRPRSINKFHNLAEASPGGHTNKPAAESPRRPSPLRQPQDHIAAAIARTAHGGEAVQFRPV
jgi:hypothetical protein